MHVQEDHKRTRGVKADKFAPKVPEHLLLEGAADGLL